MAHQWSLALCECMQKVDQIPPDRAIYYVCLQIRRLAGWSDRSGSHQSPRPASEDGYASVSKHECVFEYYSLLLALSLEIGFRHSPVNWSIIPVAIKSLANKEYHLLMVEVMLRAASNPPCGYPVRHERRVLYAAGIEDALYVWTLGGRLPPLGLCTSTLGKIINSLIISPRLRVLLVRAIGSMEYEDLERAGLEMIVGILDVLKLKLDDMWMGGRGSLLLKPLIWSKFGRERLPLRYWRLLEELIAKDVEPRTRLCYPDTLAMKALEESEEWEKLEVWSRIVWTTRVESETGTYLEDVFRVSLPLLQHRPSAISWFASTTKTYWHCLSSLHNTEFRRICDQAT